MDEEIKEEERSADEAGKHGNDDPWVKQMEEKLASKSKQCQPSHPFTFCKVARDIRGVDSAAHDPLVVSIGPYHRGNPSLLDMEQVKWLNLSAFRDRAGKDFIEYLKAMKEIAPRARACYSGNIDMEADEFIEMMLLDGLFMIKLFSTRGIDRLIDLLEKEEPTIYTIRGMLCRFGRDMLLLENQLPFFVLERLCSLSTDQWTRFDLWNNARTFTSAYALPCENEWKLDLLGVIFDEEEEKGENLHRNEDGVHHLLHLVYLLLKPTSTGSSFESMEPTEKPPAFIKKMKALSFLPPKCRDCFPSPSGQESQSMKCAAKLPAFIKKMITLSFLRPICHSSPSSSGQESQSTECTAKLPAVIENILPFLSPSMSKDEQRPPLSVIPSAVELDEAGVQFQCVKAKRFLDVKFEQGMLKMPRLSVVDSTKPLLRNFIAYERCFPNQGDHISSYSYFMDLLVSTARDVEILKEPKIIENCLGCDEEVALLFNDLCKGPLYRILRRVY